MLVRSGVILPSLLIQGNTSQRWRWWWNIDNCATIPKGAIPPPYGTHASKIFAGQYFRARPISS